MYHLKCNHVPETWGMARCVKLVCAADGVLYSLIGYSIMKTIATLKKYYNNVISILI